MQKTGRIILLAMGFLASIVASAVASPAEQHGCVDCHRFSSEDTRESPIGPDLFYAGDKFQEEWLAAFLRNPVTIRKAGHTNDPGFLLGDPKNLNPHQPLADKDAADMTQYLMTLRLPDLVTGKVDAEPLSKGKRVRVKILFERDFSCIACHEGINLAGKARGGVSGPSLANAGNRLQPDWIYNWLKTPEKFLEKRRMPVLDLDDETAVQLTKYIMSLKLGSGQ
jgi:mono/diheme cytochrome c family protein